MMLSDVCRRLTSVAYIGPKSRKERHRKTKIGKEVAHITRVSDTTFKVKGQRSRSQGRGHIVEASRTACYTPPLIGGDIKRCFCLKSDHENVLGVGNYCYDASAQRRARRLYAHREGEGRGHIVSLRTQFVISFSTVTVFDS